MNKPKRGRPKKNQESKQSFEPEYVEIAPEIYNLKVVRQMPNPRWVGCDMDGTLIKVAISPRYTNKLVGKTIKVAKVRRDLIEEYEYIP